MMIQSTFGARRSLLKNSLFFGSIPIKNVEQTNLHIFFQKTADFQIWDADMKDDFLGECYLPPLGSLTAASKRYVLPVTNAAPEKGATRTLVWQIFLLPEK